MITVTISETNGKRKWSHRARTKDAMTAIIRTMNKHFPLGRDSDRSYLETDVAEGNSLERQRFRCHRHAP